MKRNYNCHIHFDDNKEVGQMTTPMNKLLYFEYDKDGKQIQVHDNITFIGSYKYDDKGRLMEYSDTDGFDIKYIYSEEELIGMIVDTVDTVTQLVSIGIDTLVPVYGSMYNKAQSIRVFDEMGYLVDYSDNEVFGYDCYGDDSIQDYELKKITDGVIELQFAK